MRVRLTTRVLDRESKPSTSDVRLEQAMWSPLSIRVRHMHLHTRLHTLQPNCTTTCHATSGPMHATISPMTPLIDFEFLSSLPSQETRSYTQSIQSKRFM